MFIFTLVRRGDLSGLPLFSYLLNNFPGFLGLFPRENTNLSNNYSLFASSAISASAGFFTCSISNYRLFIDGWLILFCIHPL